MQRWEGKATFIGVAWSGTNAEFQEFVTKHGLTFAQISDPAGEVFARFQVSSQPAMVIVGPSGKVTQSFASADESTVDALLNSAIADA